MQGFAETGAGINNRTVAGADTSSFNLHPGAEIGATLTAGPFDSVLRPRLRLGLDWIKDPSFSTTGALAGAIPLIEMVETDHMLGNVEAGLTLFAQDDLAVDLGYRGMFGADTTAHSAEFRVNLNF